MIDSKNGLNESCWKFTIVEVKENVHNKLKKLDSSCCYSIYTINNTIYKLRYVRCTQNKKKTIDKTNPLSIYKTPIANTLTTFKT